MATYVILCRISPEAVKDPKNFKDLAKTVSETIKQQCPGVIWKDSYATLGRFDVVDIVEAAKPEEVQKTAMIIRSSVQTARGATAEKQCPWKRPPTQWIVSFFSMSSRKRTELAAPLRCRCSGGIEPVFCRAR